MCGLFVVHLCLSLVVICLKNRLSSPLCGYPGSIDLTIKTAYPDTCGTWFKQKVRNPGLEGNVKPLIHDPDFELS